MHGPELGSASAVPITREGTAAPSALFAHADSRPARSVAVPQRACASIFTGAAGGVGRRSLNG